MMEGNTEEPQTESGRAGTGVCWWKRRALRRGHGSWCSNVGVVLGLCANLWLLGAHGKSVGFLQLSSRPSKLICTDPNPSPSSTVQDPPKGRNNPNTLHCFYGKLNVGWTKNGVLSGILSRCNVDECWKHDAQTMAPWRTTYGMIPFMWDVRNKQIYTQRQIGV